MPELLLLAIIFLLVLAAYYSFVALPKQRDFQKRQRYVSTLNVGDEVITYGGIIGRVIEVYADQGIAHVEIAEGVVVRMVAAALMQPYDPEELAKSARRVMKQETPQDR